MGKSYLAMAVATVTWAGTTHACTDDDLKTLVKSTERYSAADISIVVQGALILSKKTFLTNRTNHPHNVELSPIYRITE